MVLIGSGQPRMARGKAGHYFLHHICGHVLNSLDYCVAGMRLQETWLSLLIGRWTASTECATAAEGRHATLEHRYLIGHQGKRTSGIMLHQVRNSGSRSLSPYCKPVTVYSSVNLAYWLRRITVPEYHNTNSVKEWLLSAVGVQLITGFIHQAFITLLVDFWRVFVLH